jgi:hypothetical protein
VCGFALVERKTAHERIEYTLVPSIPRPTRAGQRSMKRQTA